MSKLVGREHDKQKVLARLARAGLKVDSSNIIDIANCRHAVGNKTLGMLDYLASQYGIHYGRSVGKHGFTIIN